MAFSNDMKLLERCRISPESSSVSRMSMPLTFFDLMWLPFPPVQRLLFYQLDCSKASFIDTILPNLKNSLSMTLNHFFPMAGNLTLPLDSIKPEILYLEGDSVSFTVCESDHNFCELVGNQVGNANTVLHPFIPELNMSNRKHFPVLALQVTLFPNKGICIGITFHHTVADGKAFIHFVKSWASISKDNTSFLAITPLCYDRTIVKDPKGIDMKLLKYFKKFDNFNEEASGLSRHHFTPTVPKVLATVVLGQFEIMRIKSWFSKEKGMDLSTFVVTSAYVWVCWVKARRGCKDVVDDLMEGFLFQIDCRERLDPAIPPNYFGNCLICAMAKGKTSDLVGKDGLWIAAEAIGNVIKTTKGNDKIFEYTEAPLSRIPSISFDGILSTAGSPRFGVYEIDFGWGNPIKTQVVSTVNTGAACFSECPGEPRAVQISLALKPIEMEAFTSFFENTIHAIP